MFNSKTVKKNASSSNIAWRYDQQDITLNNLEGQIHKDIPKLDLSKTEDPENVKKLVNVEHINNFKSFSEVFSSICS